MGTALRSDLPAAREGWVPVKNGELFYREVGQGRPIIVIHGGPDFDHTILLPDMDRLADDYRLIYYDQRGRGQSRGELRPEDIRIEQTIADLDELRKHLGLESVALLGHSWGGLVAMHYAVQHPKRVAHMVLMNTAPAAYEDYLLVRQDRSARTAVHGEKLKALAASAAYAAGDPDTVAEYYRIIFSTTIKRPEHVERLNLRWTQADVLRGRIVEYGFPGGVYWAEGFTLLPELARVSSPTLVLHGDYDFVPVPCAAHIAQAIPGARLVVLKDCGHFAYIEAPAAVREVMGEFFAGG